MVSEDDVSRAVAAYLEGQGFADVKWLPAGRQGFDISTGPSATHPGWLIEAKGSVKSGDEEERSPFGRGAIYNNVAQAFARAAYWRDHAENNGRSVGMAIPVAEMYDVHSKRLERACRELGITIFRVAEDHSVHVT